MELKDWSVEYVKARNAMTKTLVEHTSTGDEVTFTHKHKVHHFWICPKLDIPENARDWYTVVCHNSERNVKFLLENYDHFCKDKLTVLFANTTLNQSWQINPKLHKSVADPETLKQGVETMAQEVPFV